jgi:hypothetical protein
MLKASHVSLTEIGFFDQESLLIMKNIAYVLLENLDGPTNHAHPVTTLTT